MTDTLREMRMLKFRWVDQFVRPSHDCILFYIRGQPLYNKSVLTKIWPYAVTVLAGYSDRVSVGMGLRWGVSQLHSLSPLFSILT
jgi:hypothetical protein